MVAVFQFGWGSQLLGIDQDVLGRAALAAARRAGPEVALASGDLLVSISRNTTDLSRLMKDPQVGRPEFVQLPR